MSVHLIKLCVGIDQMEELAAWQKKRLAKGQRLEHWTRMTPKRADELLAGGSLYWVIKGRIQARQKLTALDQGVDSEGVPHCILVLDSKLVPVAPRPQRPFQGWRYLKTEDAPPDLNGAQTQDLPPELAAHLAELGLL